MGTTHSASAVQPSAPGTRDAGPDDAGVLQPPSAGAAARAAARRARLVPPMPDDGVWGWLGPLLVTLVGGVVRFVRLGSPHAVVFDETYYAKDAWTLLHYGYERNWQGGDTTNQLVLAGHPSQAITAGGSFVVHPPLGKWLIALGEWAFGLTPFGWRVGVAVLGTLSVLLLARIGRRLFRSTLLGCVAGLLLALDGLAVVLSRTALLDGIVMFWTLAAFGSLLVDRDRSRARLASGAAGLGLRPWRIGAGVCLGAACATKWSGLYVVVAFGLLTVLWDVGGRRAAGQRRPLLGVLRRDAVPAFVSVVGSALVVYLASWTGWLATSGGYDRDWADGRSSSWSFVPAPLRSMWFYHSQILNFHRTLETPHPYQSNPWSWLVLGRPVSFYYETVNRGVDGCGASQCSQEVLGLGTPALWWAAVPALVVLLWLWAARRDWRAGAVLCGVAGGYLPWFELQQRTIFSFYAVAFVPFLALAVAMVLGLVLGPRPLPDGTGLVRRRAGAVAVGVYLVVVVGCFAYFYPIYVGATIPYSTWLHHMWLRSWI